MIVRELETGEESRWDAFVASHPAASHYALSGWRGVLHASYGHSTHYLLAEEQGAIVGVLPLFRVRGGPIGGHYVSSMPGGACATTRGAERGLLELALAYTEQRRADYLVLRDSLEERIPDARFVTSGRHCTLVATLPEREAGLSKLVASSARRAVKKAQAAGLTVSQGGVELLGPFYRVFCQNMRDLGTPVLGRRFVEEVLRAFPTQTQLLVAFLGAEPVGGMFLFAHGDRAHNPWFSSLREHFERRPNDLLSHEALRWAVGRGLRSLDFGRSQWDSGTFKFKEKWGAKPVPLHYHYYLRRGGEVPDVTERLERDPVYRLAQRTWQRLPLGLANRLGPLLVKYLNPLG
ncbi:MAG: GNAT family N-acetyltransferase [Deltaproteobacteria bacterium]|nr:GNAT family N-acetyltransferase [Deltaproteobacteria bacterium]